MVLPAAFPDDPTGHANLHATFGTKTGIAYVASPSSWLPYIAKPAVDNETHLALKDRNDHFLAWVEFAITLHFIWSH